MQRATYVLFISALVEEPRPIAMSGDQAQPKAQAEEGFDAGAGSIKVAVAHLGCLLLSERDATAAVSRLHPPIQLRCHCLRFAPEQRNERTTPLTSIVAAE